MFPGGSDGEAPVYNAGDLGLIPGSGRFPGEGRKWQPTPVLLPRNPMDGGVWCPWGRLELDMTENPLNIKFCFQGINQFCFVVIIGL